MLYHLSLFFNHSFIEKSYFLFEIGCCRVAQASQNSWFNITRSWIIDLMFQVQFMFKLRLNSLKNIFSRCVQHCSIQVIFPSSIFISLRQALNWHVVGMTLVILLLLPPKSWNYRCMPTFLVYELLGIKPRDLHVVNWTTSLPHADLNIPVMCASASEVLGLWAWVLCLGSTQGFFKFCFRNFFLFMVLEID